MSYFAAENEIFLIHDQIFISEVYHDKFLLSLKLIINLFISEYFQFLWPEFEYKHIHWGNSICNTHSYPGSSFVFPLNRQHAGIYLEKQKHTRTCYREYQIFVGLGLITVKTSADLFAIYYCEA